MAGKPDPRDTAATPKRHHFSKAVEARAKLSAKIDRYIELHEQAATNAAARGNSAPIEWLLSHAEVEEADGTYGRPIAAGIDKPQLEGKGGGNTINIGFIGGQPQPAAELVNIYNALEHPKRHELSADASASDRLHTPGNSGLHSGDS